MDQYGQTAGRSHRHRFEGPLYRRLMLGGIKHIPPPIKRLTMPFWASIFYTLVPKARRAVESNLENVLGPLSLAERKWRSFRLFWNYAQMLADTYAIHLSLPVDFDVISHNRENMLRALERGRGAIAAMGHLGMWQLAPFLAEWRGLPKFYVAMAAEPNPLVQEFERRFRERFQIVYTTESTFSALKLAQVLREGCLVGMQVDRNTSGATIEVPFCGRTAWFPSGPAMLARVTGAPLVPSLFVVEPPAPGSHRRLVQHYLESPIYVSETRDRNADIRQATAALAAVYEGFVRRYPEQWYQFFDFFAPPVASPAAAKAPPSPAAESRPEQP